MQGIYTYIPEKNHVPREYSVAGILSLLFMVSISLVLALAVRYFYVSTFRNTCAVPNMAVFCSSPTSWFPGMLLVCFLNDFEMVPVAPVITGINLVFTFHMCCISIVMMLIIIIIIIIIIRGSFHKLCTRWQNSGVDEAIPVKVMSVTVEDLRKQHVCSLLPYFTPF